MIALQGLHHSFGKRPVLFDVSLSVGPGQIFGFVGPNGAGKTTTIKALATLLAPSAGRIAICGVDAVARPEEARRHLGFVPDSVGVYEQMTIAETLDFYADASAIEPASRRREAVSMALELTGLQGLRDRPCGALSRGMRQRLSLARALVHDPEVLLLDEPASGLDPRARIELFQLLTLLQGMGKSILLSSHILAELSSVVTHLGIIEAGRMVACGDARAVAELVAQERVVLIRMLEPPGPRSEVLRALPGVLEVVEREPNLLAVTIEGDDRVVADLVRAAALAELPIVEVSREWTDLERVFLVATRGGLQ